MTHDLEEQMAFANSIYSAANAMCRDAVGRFGHDLGLSLVMHALLVSAAQVAQHAVDPEAMWKHALELAWQQAAVVLAQTAPSSEVKQ